MGDLWTTRDGTQVPVREMSDRHLINALRMLARQAEVKRALSVRAFLECEPPTADGAELCYEQEFDALLDAEWLEFVDDRYRMLVAEADRRQLDYEDYIEPESALSLEFR